MLKDKFCVWLNKTKITILNLCRELCLPYVCMLTVYLQQHVQDGRKESLEGYVKTFDKPLPADGDAGVFALDCEMVSDPSKSPRVASCRVEPTGQASGGTMKQDVMD